VAKLGDVHFPALYAIILKFKGEHMNIIAKEKPKAKISVEEMDRRREEVDYARGSVRLEGFVISPLVEDLNRKYIEGDITGKELTAAVLSHYKL
jgi:hypothetical protein